jgi:hypothetical protein
MSMSRLAKFTVRNCADASVLSAAIGSPSAQTYYTGHPDYLWLNRLQCVGTGEVDMTKMRVTYDIYAMR